MYSRAPRTTDIRAGTTSNIGPGSYEIRSTRTNKLDGYAPFLSLSSRPSVFDKSVSELCSPGPGHYDGVLISAASVVGGQSLQNRSKRFEEELSDCPGPGAYNITQPFGKKTNLHSVHDRGSKSVWTRMTLQKGQTGVASIPSPGQAYGYEENEHHVLCKHKPPSTDQSLGPAFYSPTQVESQYKGVHFSKMTGKRGEVNMAQGPGPGEYYPDGDHSVCYENVNLRRELKKQTEVRQIHRYHELLPLLEEKRGVPGPGHYLVKSQFDKPTTQYGAAASRPPFMTRTPRFRPGKEVAPPVGTYNDPRCALDSLKKAGVQNRSPFSLSAARFLPGNRKYTTPGPGAYNLFDYGIAQDSLKKAYLDSAKKGGFGSTAQRTLVFLTKEEAHGPGPTHYTVNNPPEESYKQQPTAAFRSATERLTTSLHAKDTPPPTSHQGQQVFEQIPMWPRAPPRSQAARKRQSCFLSSAPRSSSFLCCDPQIPGPGHYSPEMKTKPKLAFIGSCEDRFKQSKDTTPGPGAYVLSPPVMDTVLKGTFNVTLCNPLVPHGQTVPPQAFGHPLCLNTPPLTLHKCV
ncbi:sperm-tail PG-rich repeat-containing protein 2 [Brachyhypopomus gauderio]|uniref:sperm-tail PG-rich repeat-containing protein 2 n=1 Tax=Brachyhypopomus gauderio TaxID=698409 RepID=UPI0040437474